MTVFLAHMFSGGAGIGSNLNSHCVGVVVMLLEHLTEPNGRVAAAANPTWCIIQIVSPVILYTSVPVSPMLINQ